MTEEIKARLNDPESAREKLDSEASFEEELDVRDIYFKHPEDEVLKIRRDDNGDWLVKYSPKGEGFEKVEEKCIEEEQIQELKRDQRVKTVQDKTIRRYSWKSCDLLLISIAGVGEFLVVQGENVSREVFDRLGIDVSGTVEVAFSELG